MISYLSFLGSVSGKEPACQSRRHKKYGFDPWVRKIPWRRAWQPIPIFLPGESHGQKSLGATVHRATKSQTWLKQLSMHSHLVLIFWTLLSIRSNEHDNKGSWVSSMHWGLSFDLKVGGNIGWPMCSLICIYIYMKVAQSCLDSLWPHGLYSPWNSPGQNTGVGSCSLLQGIFPIQRLNPDLPHCRQILYQLSHQGSTELEWVAYSFCKRSSWPRNWAWVSGIAGGFFTSWAIRVTCG